MGRLSGKVAIITGAAGGMGLAAAGLFAREGANVVATDVQGDLLRPAIAELGQGEGSVVAVEHDITSVDSWAAVVGTAVEQFGTVDILINNAAIGNFTPLLESTPEEWLHIYKVDVVGAAMGMKAVLPIMQERGAGSIVNTSSCSAVAPELTVGTAYAAAKGAVIPMTKHVALEVAAHGIRVNAVIPGAVWTTGIANLGISHDQMAAQFKDKSPLPPHAGLPMHVANAYLFLASDESEFITGIALPVDGGNTM